MGAICGEIVGVFQGVFPSGLFHHVRVSAKCLSVAGLECFEPGRDILPLGAEGPPRVAFGVVPPKGVLSTGSGKGCHLLGLGDRLGTDVGKAAVVGCSSMGEVFCCRMGGGDGGDCPIRMSYEVARVPLGLWWTVVQDHLTSGEKVITTPALLSNGLFL